MENPQGKFPAEFNTYKVVEPDDLVFCLFDVEETPRTVGHASQHGMITGAYTVVEVMKNLYPRFLYYFYLSLDYDKRLKSLYTGLRNVIQKNTFSGMKIPMPSMPEQENIVLFLDDTISQIEAISKNSQKQIKLLQEYKSIVISLAVTGKIKV